MGRSNPAGEAPGSERVSRSESEPEAASLHEVEVAKLPECVKPAIGGEETSGSNHRTSRGDFRPSVMQVAFGMILALLIFAYPFIFERIVAEFGVRAGAVALLSYGVVFALIRRLMGIPVQVFSLPHFLLLFVVVGTLTSGDVRYILFVPAFIYLALCRVFWRSLDGPISMVEHVARFIVPVAPDFIRPYCRKSTVGWSGLFLANAMVIAWFALTNQISAWRAYTGWQMFALIGVICTIDFLFRKWWFRYYFHENLFDRIWARFFPAENTSRGRQSMEYIRKMREELGLPPP